METEFYGTVLLVDYTGKAIAIFIVFIFQQEARCKTIVRHFAIDRCFIEQEPAAMAIGKRNGIMQAAVCGAGADVHIMQEPTAEHEPWAS